MPRSSGRPSTTRRPATANDRGSGGGWPGTASASRSPSRSSSSIRPRSASCSSGPATGSVRSSAGSCTGWRGIAVAVGFATFRYHRIRFPDAWSYPGALLNTTATAFIDEVAFRGALLGLLLVAGVNPTHGQLHPGARLHAHDPAGRARPRPLPAPPDDGDRARRRLADGRHRRDRGRLPRPCHHALRLLPVHRSYRPDASRAPGSSRRSRSAADRPRAGGSSGPGSRPRGTADRGAGVAARRAVRPHPVLRLALSVLRLRGLRRGRGARAEGAGRVVPGGADGRARASRGRAGRSLRARPTGARDRLPRWRDAVAPAGRGRRRPARTQIRSRFGLAAGAEVTLEANPGPDERGDAAAPRGPRGSRDCRSAPSRCRTRGFADWVGVIGRPTSATPSRRRAPPGSARSASTFCTTRRTPRLADWIETLEAALALEPDHLSLYALTLDDPDAEGLTGPGGDHLPTTAGARRWRDDRSTGPGRGPRRRPVPPRRPPPRRRRLARLRDQQLGPSRPREPAQPRLLGAPAVRGGRSGRARLRRRRRDAGTRPVSRAISPHSRRPVGEHRRLPPGGAETIDAETAAAETVILGLRTDRGVPARGGPGTAAGRRLRLGARRRAARRHPRRPDRPDDPRPAALERAVLATDRLAPPTLCYRVLHERDRTTSGACRRP